MKSSLANLLDGVSREFLASMRSSTNLSRDRCKYVPVSPANLKNGWRSVIHKAVLCKRMTTPPTTFLSVRVPEQVAEAPLHLSRFVFRAFDKLIITIFLTIFIGACGEKALESTNLTSAPINLERIQVQLKTIPTEITFDGRVEAVNQATVAAQTSGRVIELPFDVGDLVEKGSVILRLTDTEQKSRVEAARAQRQEANTRMEEAQNNFARARELLDKKLIAKADFDRANAEFNAAKARLESAEAALAEAEQNLAYTTLVAPYSGILLTRHVRVGESVAPGTPLLTGLSLAQLRVAVDISQQHIGPLRKHRTARVQLPDGEWIAAKELRIPPAADGASQTFKMLVELPELNQEMYPGTLVKVGFVSGEQQQLAVPNNVLIKRGELTGVYVLPPDGRAQLRYVRLGVPTADGQVPVLAGLSDGEWIAVDPVAAALAYKQAQGETSP